ncbi:MAG: NADH-quinone oxidoreductase subunit NuoE [Candidatus Rifleibacteriota bacterium]
MNPQNSANVRNFEKLCSIIEQYNHDSSKLIPIMQAVQEEYRYLPEEVISYLATSLKIPPAQVYGVATFYSHFALKPKGKYVIKICDGTACHVKKSIPILEALMKKLELTEEKMTTDDMLFTVETVSCLGACGLAPVLMINEEVHGLMNPETTVELIDQIKAQEKGN